MVKRPNVTFRLSQEQSERLDNYLKVKTGGEEIYVVTKSDFFKTLLNDTLERYDHVLDYLKAIRRKRKVKIKK